MRAGWTDIQQTRGSATARRSGHSAGPDARLQEVRRNVRGSHRHWQAAYRLFKRRVITGFSNPTLISGARGRARRGSKKRADAHRSALAVLDASAFAPGRRQSSVQRWIHGIPWVEYAGLGGMGADGQCQADRTW